ncbi:MAG: flagellar export protein FliJ [Thermodesulfobacteriota bacterium]|nr:flagellar export protein FliJ [Thermodesulfobacteriota bacterium]
MKKFIFRLESLLIYRNHLEYIARQEMAEAYRQVKALEESIFRLKEEFSAAAQQLDTASARGITARMFKEYTDYLNAVERDIAAETDRKKTLEKALWKSQDRLREKSVDRKAIERLKEKQKKQYVDEFLKVEQKSLDEVMALKKAREINNES